MVLSDDDRFRRQSTFPWRSNRTVVHVAYQDSNGQKVMYAETAAASWSAPVVVDSTGVSGQGISLAVDNERQELRQLL